MVKPWGRQGRSRGLEYEVRDSDDGLKGASERGQSTPPRSRARGPCDIGEAKSFFMGNSTGGAWAAKNAVARTKI